jgi:hypothetical protein
MENGDVFALMAVFAVILIGLAFAAVTVWIWWRIVSRTGHSCWLALLVIVPLANLILLLILAFGEWPIYRELEDLRRRVGSA